MEKKNQLFEKYYKKNKIKLFIGILFVIVGIGFFSFCIYDQLSTKKNAKDMIDVVNDEIKVNKDQIVYVTLSAVPHKIGTIDTRDDGQLYFIYDEEYWYVAFLKNKEITDITQKVKNDEEVKIYAYTKQLTSTIKTKAKAAFNNLDYDLEITNKNFETYFGSIYLDTTIKGEFQTVYFIIGGLLIIIGAIMAIDSRIKNKNIGNILNHYSEGERENILSEFSDETNVKFNKGKIVLTRNYFINTDSNLRVIEYKDMAWVYSFEEYVNGVPSHLSLIIYTTTKERITINKGALNKKNKAEIQEIMEIFYRENNEIIFGYNYDNRKLAEQMYNIR